MYIVVNPEHKYSKKQETLGISTEMNSKDLSRITFRCLSNPKYDGYQCRLTSMGFKFVDTKTAQRETGISENKELTN